MVTDIRIVVAADEHNGIGKNNRLLVHLPADLKHFKALTVGFPVIMGRKTYDSIGKPLPNRRNIVVTRQNLQIDGCETAHSLEESLEMCLDEEAVSIIGGATLFNDSLQLAQTLHLTRIHHTFDADTFFPEIPPDEWLTSESQYVEADEKNPFPYSFITMKKR